jgi:hypothetical protein
VSTTGTGDGSPDFGCPFSKQAESTLKELPAQYQGKVRPARRLRVRRCLVRYCRSQSGRALPCRPERERRQLRVWLPNMKITKHEWRVARANRVHARSNLDRDAVDERLAAHVLHEVELIAELGHDSGNVRHRLFVHQPSTLRRGHIGFVQRCVSCREVGEAQGGCASFGTASVSSGAGCRDRNNASGAQRRNKSEWFVGAGSVHKVFADAAREPVSRKRLDRFTTFSVLSRSSNDSSDYKLRSRNALLNFFILLTGRAFRVPIFRRKYVSSFNRMTVAWAYIPKFLSSNKHLILGALIFRHRAEKNQLLAGTGSSRFLGKQRTARCAVPLDIPKTSQISAQERPSLRSVAILSRSTFTRGLPRHFPRDFANANPDLTRSRISSLSNSAIDAKIPKTRRPFGVDVSTPSCRLTKSIPRARNSC